MLKIICGGAYMCQYFYISAYADKNYASAWIFTRKQYVNCKIYPKSMHVLDTLIFYARTLGLAHETAVR